MPNLTTHAIVRYAERFKKDNIKGNINLLDSNKRKRYEKEIIKMYSFSKAVYIGAFKNYQKAIFRLANDVMLITDLRGRNIITLFRVDFGLANRKNNKNIQNNIVKDLFNEKSLIRCSKKKLSNFKGDIESNEYSSLRQDYLIHCTNYNNLAEKLCYSSSSRKFMHRLRGN